MIVQVRLTGIVVMDLDPGDFVDYEKERLLTAIQHEAQEHVRCEMRLGRGWAAFDRAWQRERENYRLAVEESE